jgi:uncharacterized cofD-like protein
MNIKDLSRRFKWLYPGLKVKRWIFLCSIGVILVGIGFLETLSREIILSDRIRGIFILSSGIALVIVSIKKMMGSFITIFLPQRERELVDIMYQKRQLERGPKVVAIGGGTGLSTLLTGLKRYTSNVTAIVTVSDEGGSSGRLRDEFDVLPPGDIRNCLVALADAEPLMGDLFQFRFNEGSGLLGHNFGNLFITALTKVTGDFEKAIKAASNVLAIRGQVVPSTLKKVRLVAEHTDGSQTIGETNVSSSQVPIKRISLIPPDCLPTQGAMEAIGAADAIILGPGSLYTSLIPNLLIGKLSEAIAQSQALRIYVCNIMTQPGETDGYSAFDHLNAIINHARRKLIDYCIVNVGNIPNEALQKYRLENSFPVAVDSQKIRDLGFYTVESDVVSSADLVRHDPEKLARVIMDLISRKTKKKSCPLK